MNQTFDEIGRLLTRTEVSAAFPGGVSTTYTYDQLSQPLTITGPAILSRVSGVTHQARRTFTYDANSLVTQVVAADVTGGDTARTQSITYDLGDLAVSKTDAEGGVWATEYDANSNVPASVDALGRRSETAYNARNLATAVTLKAYTTPLGGAPRDVVQAQYGYDNDGRVASETDPLGRVTTTLYDSTGLVKQRVLQGFHKLAGGTENVVLQQNDYDKNGQDLCQNQCRQLRAWTGNGRRVEQYAYDAAGRANATTLNPTGVVAAGLELNRTTTVTAFNNADQPLTVQSTDGTRTEETRYTYDAIGRNTAVTTENGATDITRTIGYDDRGLAVQNTDPNANVTDSYFDEVGRLFRVVSPLVPRSRFGQADDTVRPDSGTGYHTFCGPTQSKDGDGFVTSYTYDRLGRRTVITYPTYTAPGGSPVTPTEQFVYDADSNMVTQTDRRGQTTSYQYDSLNRSVKSTLPTVGGQTPITTTTFDDLCNPAQTVDATGAARSATFDDLNRVRTSVVTVRQPTTASFTTTSDYDYLGNLTATTDAQAHTWSYGFNGASEQVSGTDPLGYGATLTHDLAGRTTQTVDPAGRKMTLVYDLAGRVTEQASRDATGAALKKLTIAYDANGNRTSVTNLRNATTTYAYDALNRQTSMTPPGIAPSTSGYDTRSMLTKATDGKANTTWYTYQPWRLRESIVEPATAAHPALPDRTYTISFDAGGLAVTVAQPGGVAVQRTYDALWRMTTESGSGGGSVAASRTLGYDLASRLTSVNFPGGTQSFGYDDRGLILSSTGPAGTTSWAYNPVGLVASRVDVAGTSTYTYTNRNEMAQIGDPISGPKSFVYTPERDLASATHGQTVRTFTYDGIGRVASDSLKNAQTNAPLTSNTYTYDVAGNVTSQNLQAPSNPAAGLSTYAYDLADRLISWTAPSGPVTNYAYDAAGNRTQAGASTFTYDERNRLTSAAFSKAPALFIRLWLRPASRIRPKAPSSYCAVS